MITPAIAPGTNPASNGWTGGQYSLLRALAGSGLSLACGVRLGASGWPEMLLPLAALVLSLHFAAGWRDRVAAGGLALMLFALGWPWLGGLLLGHCFLPAAPYGSLAARGRPDPGGGWRLPQSGLHVARIAAAAGWTYLGVCALADQLPMPGGDFFVALGLLHLIAFDPAWLRPAPARDGTPAAEVVFYDGHCGLCHRFVRFVLAEDRGGMAFRFAPLDGAALRRAVPEAERAALPDSVVVLGADGTLLVRSAAALHVARRLGGWWRVLAAPAALIPRSVRDLVYDGVAAVRHRLFRRPADACPLLPPSLRSRFDLEP